MTENELRRKVTTIAENYARAGNVITGSAALQKIIDIYNAHKPLARNLPYSYSLGGWCELFADTCFIEAGVSELITTEIGPWEAMQAAKKDGIWKAKGAYDPKPGDKIYYAYEKPEGGVQFHVGIVTNASAAENIVYSTEGNVESRVMMVAHKPTAKEILGYIAPDYASLATPDLIPVSELPAPPSKTGTYSLKAVVSNNKTTYKWE